VEVASLRRTVGRLCWRAFVLALAVLGVASLLEGISDLHYRCDPYEARDGLCDGFSEIGAHVLAWPLILFGLAILLCIILAYLPPFAKPRPAADAGRADAFDWLPNEATSSGKRRAMGALRADLPSWG
jgi:hypothetical protein